MALEKDRVRLLEGWTIELPHGFTSEIEPDGALVLWDATVTIRVQSISTGGRADGSAFSAREMLGDSPGEIYELGAGGLVTVGAEFVEQIGDSAVWTVPVAGASPNQLVSVYFQTLDPNQLDWVGEVARTLQRE